MMSIGQWNLLRFAETLLPLIDPDESQAIRVAMEILEAYPLQFERYWLTGMRKKLGLQAAQDGDSDLVQDLLNWMHRTRADFTNTFRGLSSTEATEADRHQDTAFMEWHARWRQRRNSEGRANADDVMRSANPVVIPRNHRVEEALATAEGRDDFTLVHRLVEVLRSPFAERPDTRDYADPPADERGYRTFCGT
ncbi:MAG: protein adenylyltransferase SelO family protein [Gemmataceae bacterium]